MRILGLAAAAFIAAAVPARAQDAVAFSIGDVAYELPIPAGFCLPEGKGETVAQLLAAADNQHETEATLFACDQEPGVGPYYIVKSPRLAEGMAITRPEFLAMATREFGSPQFAKAISPEQVDAATETALNRVMPENVKVETAIVPRGIDDVCARVAGVMTYQAAGKTFKVEASVCMSSVGDRMVFVFYYAPGDDAEHAIRNLPVPRAMIESIRVRK